MIYLFVPLYFSIINLDSGQKNSEFTPTVEEGENVCFGLFPLFYWVVCFSGFELYELLVYFGN